MKRALLVAGILGCLMVGLVVPAFGQDSNDDAWIPGLASFLIPGLGQLLNDELDRALIHFGVDVAIYVAGFTVGAYVPYTWYVVPAVHLAWAVYSGIDAYNVAKETKFRLGWTEQGATVAYAVRF